MINQFLAGPGTVTCLVNSTGAIVGKIYIDSDAPRIELYTSTGTKVIDLKGSNGEAVAALLSLKDATGAYAATFDASAITANRAVVVPNKSGTMAYISDVTAAVASKADLVGGKVPAAQLPSYVDDVIEGVNLAAFPDPGERGKIYVAVDTNKTYRWTGSTYVEISVSVVSVESYANLSAFPVTGVDSKIYIAEDTNLLYRWDGSAYVGVGGGGNFATSNLTFTGDRSHDAAGFGFNMNNLAGFGFNTAGPLSYFSALYSEGDHISIQVGDGTIVSSIDITAGGVSIGGGSLEVNSTPVALESSASGTFTSADGKTVTVTNGIITSIV